MSGTRPRHVRDMSHRLASPEEESAALEREGGAYCVMTSGTTSAAKTVLIEAEDLPISRADRSGRRVHVSRDTRTPRHSYPLYSRAALNSLPSSTVLLA